MDNGARHLPVAIGVDHRIRSRIGGLRMDCCKIPPTERNNKVSPIQ